MKQHLFTHTYKNREEYQGTEWIHYHICIQTIYKYTALTSLPDIHRYVIPATFLLTCQSESTTLPGEKHG